MLNLRYRRQHGGTVPPLFIGSIDGATLGRIQSYNADREAYGLWRLGATVPFVLWFYFGTGLEKFDQLVNGLPLPQLIQGVTFFVLLQIAVSILDLPLDAISTFYIEQKHGFNRSTPRLFLMDWLKGTVLGSLLWSLVCVCGLWLMRASPNLYFLWFWGFAVGLALLLMFLSPYVIEPLFIKTAPVDTESLAAEIRALAERAGVKVTQVLKMDASRRTGHANAYFTGIGSVKRVVLFDTLLAQLSHEEVLAVLAHELGHWKLRHVTQRLITFALLALGLLYVISRSLGTPTMLEVLGYANASSTAQITVVAFMIATVGFWITPLSSYWSRVHEWQADAFARKLLGHPEALASALVKLARDNLSNLHPHPWFAAFYYSHPTTQNRVAQLQAHPSNVPAT